ncbi:MAG: hypothetical protein ACRCSK_02465 [Fusobacteriaceae bacterium]
MSVFFKKHKKKLIAIASVFAFFGATVYGFIFHLAFMVTLILNLALKPTFVIKGEVDLSEKGKIKATDLRLYYDLKKIIDAPYVEIDYDLSKKPMEIINTITVFDANVNVTRKHSNVNIARAFSTGSPGKTGTGIPIQKIVAKNAHVTYTDNSYVTPIVAKIPVANGYVVFDNIRGIDLLFDGVPDRGEYVAFGYSNFVEDFLLTVKGKNINIDTNILQYATYVEGLNFIDGKANLDLTVADSGFYGNAKVKNMSLTYDQIDDTAKNINGEVLFLKEKIQINADAFILGKQNKFSLTYDSTPNVQVPLLIKFDIGKIPVATLKKINIFKEASLEKIKYNFDDVQPFLKLVKLKNSNETEFVAGVDFKLQDIKLADNNLRAEKIAGKVEYKNEILNVTVPDMRVGVSGVSKKLALNFQMKNQKFFVGYSFDGFEGKGEMKFNENNLNIIFDSGLAAFNFVYDYDASEIFVTGTKEGDTFDSVYDIKNNNLEKMTGVLSLNFIKNLTGTLDTDIKNNAGKINSLSIKTTENISVLNLSGDLDINKNNYNISYSMNRFPFSIATGSDNLDVILSLQGRFLKESKTKKLIFDTDGTIEELKFKDFVTKGIYVALRLTDKNLEILNFGNSFLQGKGNYIFADKNSDIVFVIRDLTPDEIGISKDSKLKFNIKDGVGKISGALDNPKINFNIKDAEILLRDKPVKISGASLLFDSKINISSLKINDTTNLSGNINIKDLSYNIKGNIYEEKVSDYLNLIEDIKYRVIGMIEVKGKKKDINIETKFSIDKIFMKGIALPKIFGELEYSAKNLSDGTLTVKELSFYQKDYKIGEITGKLDIGNKNYNLSTNTKNIELSKIFIGQKTSGFVDLVGEIFGTFDNPKYSVGITAKNFVIEEIPFENLNFFISGDKNLNLKLARFNFDYQGNTMETFGNINLKNMDYNFSMSSPNIKLGFLNLLLKDYGVEEVKGEAAFNLRIDTDGNSGSFLGKDIGFKAQNLGINLDTVDFNFILKDKNLAIKEFKGKSNRGTIDLKGYIELPTIGAISKNPYFYEDLKYDFALQLKNIIYELPEYMKFLVNTDLQLNQKRLAGTVSIENGLITNIPGLGGGFNIVKILKEFILGDKNKTVASGTNISSSSMDDIRILQNTAIDIDLKINQPIKMDVRDVLSLVEDLQGELSGGGKFGGHASRANFVGDFQINKGTFTFNNKNFNIGRAMLIFNKPNEYFPKVNPTLLFETTAKNLTDFVEISINGELNNLAYTVKDSKGVSSGAVLGLLYDKNINEQTPNNQTTTEMMTNVIGSTVADSVIIDPISKGIKSVFGLSKFRISSDVNLSQEDGVDAKTAQKISFGLKGQLEYPVYKDKGYLVMEGKFPNIVTSNSGATTSTANAVASSAFGTNVNTFMAGAEIRPRDTIRLKAGGEAKLQTNISEGVEAGYEGKYNIFLELSYQRKFESIDKILRRLNFLNRLD